MKDTFSKSIVDMKTVNWNNVKIPKKCIGYSNKKLIKITMEYSNK